ncbi:class I SAM-dependent methyltransferase [Candidatus Omnitrophota bacterium]
MNREKMTKTELLEFFKKLPIRGPNLPNLSHYKGFFYGLTPAERVLDVGAGHGELARGFKRCQYECVEISAARADILRKKGFQVYEQPFEEFTTNKPYDRVVFSQVLMHLYSPDEIIKKAYSILRTGGLFISSQYNQESIIPQSKKAITHLFTPKTLGDILEKHGFQVLFVRFRPTSMYTYLRLQNVKGSKKFILKIIDQPLKFIMTLGLSNYFTIIAKKK